MSESEKSFGLTQCIAIALGGMIGGGIFAVLGVVAQITQAATWFAFVLAGIVAFCASYSYTKLNNIADDSGGSVTFIQDLVGNSKLAGMVGWTLLFGYIGSMAMYAYAFGSFSVGLGFIPETLAGVPLRPVLSVAVIAGFVGLILLGTHATGSTEEILVAVKILILLVMGIGGLWYGATHNQLQFGFSEITKLSFGPVMAAAVSFVAFQGWQLLFYDQDQIKNTTVTLERSVYISIFSAVAIYIIVAITTVSLAPSDVVQSHPERALAVAAKPYLPHGFLIISLAALFSTGSAINATLFSSSYLAKGMISSHLLPDQVGDAKAEGIPVRTLIILGIITAAFSAYGSLSSITSFASLAFIVIFGAMCCLAFRERKHNDIQSWIPAVGAVGALLFFILLFYYLFKAERHTFYAVLVITAIVIAVELLYFERKPLEEDIKKWI